MALNPIGLYGECFIILTDASLVKPKSIPAMGRTLASFYKIIGWEGRLYLPYETMQCSAWLAPLSHLIESNLLIYRMRTFSSDFAVNAPIYSSSWDNIHIRLCKIAYCKTNVYDNIVCNIHRPARGISTILIKHTHWRISYVESHRNNHQVCHGKWQNVFFGGARNRLMAFPFIPTVRDDLENTWLDLLTYFWNDVKFKAPFISFVQLNKPRVHTVSKCKQDHFISF